jgi:hypothetical protein
MVALTKYQDTVEQFWTGTHNLTAAGNVVRAIIHTDAPTVATDTALANLTEITGTGYTAGGEDTQNGMTEASGTATWTATDVVWTAGAADWSSTARYVTMYNDTAAGNNVLGAYDYGATFLVGNGETFTLDFGASVGTLV